MWKLILASLGLLAMAASYSVPPVGCPPNRNYLTCAPFKDIGDIPEEGRCAPIESSSVDLIWPGSAVSTFDDKLTSRNSSTIVLTQWYTTDALCSFKNIMMLMELVYSYKANINFMVAPCPSRICTRLSASSNTELHYFGKDGKLRAKLTGGLTANEYVEKANELVDPSLHKSYVDIRKSIDDDCKDRESQIGKVYPADLEQIPAVVGVLKVAYKAMCPHLFD